MVMIATVSPSASNYEETLNTLNYANRAKSIRVILKKNILEIEDLNSEKSLVMKANQEKVLNGLKSEIIELRKLLSEKSNEKKSKFL